MRKIIVIEFISLDGIIQSPGRPDEDTSGGFSAGGWISPYSDSTLSEVIKTEMNMPFDLLLGRKTYDIWAPYWPLHNDIWPGVNRATKYVVSNSISDHEWDPSVFISGNIAEKITQIKKQEGPDLHVYGSANLIQTLMKNNLVDAFRLKIFPITLGNGKKLFAEGSIPAVYKVSESTVTSSGVIIVNYDRSVSAAAEG